MPKRDLWADHYHPGRAGYLHPRFWEDRIMPLNELPHSRQLAIWEAVQQPNPPTRILDLGVAQIDSRAWHEWHWTRGQQLRQDPHYVTRYRRKIPDAIRTAVHERDGWKCLHCGSKEGLSLDHIYPHSKGGSDDLDNLQTLCRPCNSRKGSRV